MEHNMHANLHWGYGSAPVHSTPQSHWVPPPPSNSLKRALSESDCEELFSEESSEKPISSSESGVVHSMSRKKRRGVIEKKRRDRINSSLSELKRLVPSAYEKQGSAKLEKAEILQLTVEHLKTLNSKGMDSLNFDAQRIAMDYHIIGFRECAAEVARYLVTIEGMDIQDPLRLRLMSHLQYFVQQRELSAKTCTGATTWTPPPSVTPNLYQNNCTAYQTYPATTSAYVPNLPVHPYPALSSSPSASIVHQQQQQQQQQHHHIHHHQQQQQQQTSATHRQSVPTTVTPSNETIALLNQSSSPQSNQHPSVQSQIPSVQSTHEMRSPTHHQTHSTHQHHYAPQQQTDHHAQDHNQNSSTYIELTSRQPSHVSNHRNTTPEVSSSGVAYTADTQYPDSSAGQAYNSQANLQYVSVNGSKPYRPWGAEMAY